MTKIAEGLECAFASRGFAEPSVDDLRDSAGVSLRTLYKYMPSRGDMVIVCRPATLNDMLASSLLTLTASDACVCGTPRRWPSKPWTVCASSAVYAG